VVDQAALQGGVAHAARCARPAERAGSLAELPRSDTNHGEVWYVGGVERPLHFFHLDDETAWVATCRMLVDLLCRVFVGD
jgi:hypothetical protein